MQCETHENKGAMTAVRANSLTRLLVYRRVLIRANIAGNAPGLPETERI